jgi:hypothetical protein
VKLIIKHLPNGNDKKATTATSGVLKTAQLTHVFVDAISTGFKMKIIVSIIVLLLVVTSAVDASHTRENSNVLVPNNDVNVHANIKKLLSDDDFDPQEVDEFLQIDRLLKPEMTVQASVMDINENDDDDDGDSDEKNENSIDDTVAGAVVMTTRRYKWKRTTTKTTQAFKEIFEPELGGEEELVFDNSTADLNFTTTTTTTEFFNTTTVFDNSTAIFDNTSTVFDNSTTVLETTTTTHIENATTTAAMTTPQVVNATEPTTHFTVPIHSTPTSIEPGPTANEECLVVKVSETLKWVDENGKLQMDYIKMIQEMKDLIIVDLSKSNFSETFPQLEASILLKFIVGN